MTDALLADLEAMAERWIGMGVMRSLEATVTAQRGEELRELIDKHAPVADQSVVDRLDSYSQQVHQDNIHAARARLTASRAARTIRAREAAERLRPTADQPVNEFGGFGTCEICNEPINGSHYHCACGSPDTTGQYGHHGRYCKFAGGLVKQFHHCGPNGCDLTMETTDG